MGISVGNFLEDYVEIFCAQIRLKRLSLYMQQLSGPKCFAKIVVA